MLNNKKLEILTTNFILENSISYYICIMIFIVIESHTLIYLKLEMESNI